MENYLKAGDPNQLGNLYASGRIPKLEPTETQRSQWMAQQNARSSALSHRKQFLFLLFVFEKKKS